MKVSFEFNPKTKKITNLIVEEQPEINVTLPTIRIENNKLVFSKSALELIQAEAGDRIAINYWTVNNQETFPVIGKSEVFNNDEGNKLTKSMTVSYKGQNRTTLLQYGSVFLLENFKDGMFKLVKLEQEKTNLNEEENSINDLNCCSSELEEEINSILGDENDLPF